MDTELKIDHINTTKKAGLAVKRLRKMQKLSQIELAKMMNMRQSTVSDVESGKGTLESFFKIVQALKLDMTLSNQSRPVTKTRKTSKLDKVLSYLEENN